MADMDGMGLERKQKNTLPLYGNKETMNLNSMIRTNILASPYFKEDLYQMKTFHEVIDEIYYKVEHVEPWEKNSRKLAGQVGMCAGVTEGHVQYTYELSRAMAAPHLVPSYAKLSHGALWRLVRGVAAGGIVSTPYCLLYKLFTLKLTRKQLTAMLNHTDSPYIRALGFMYIRYCQPPADFWEWFGPYLDDPEEIDLKAGGGYTVTIGEACRMMLIKLEWFGTLFPRIPVNVQKELEEKLSVVKQAARRAVEDNHTEQQPVADDEWGEAGRKAREVGRRARSPDRQQFSRSPKRFRDQSPERRRREDSRERRRKPEQPYSRDRSRERRHSRSRDRSRDRHRSRSHDRSRDRRRSRSGNRSRGRRHSRSRDRSRDRRHSRSRDRSRDRRRSRSRDRSRERRRSRSRDRSRDRRRSRSHDRSRERRRSRSHDRSRGRRRSRSRDRGIRSRSQERRRSSSRDHSRERSRRDLERSSKRRDRSRSRNGRARSRSRDRRGRS